MRDWIENQYQNSFLYVPFLLAGGAAVYFTRAVEPNLIFAPIILCALIAALFIRRMPIILRGVIIGLIGFVWAGIFTDVIDTPKMRHNVFDQNIVGTVQKIDHTYDKTRLYLSVNADDIGADGERATVRVSICPECVIPQIGDVVQVNIGLFRPNAAYAPETFDYARWAYFNGLTATGYANKIDVIRSGDSGGINTLRDGLHNRSKSFLVDALVLGFKAAVPESDTPIWTASGVGHVWSISGFHMTLVGGWLFIIFYFIFRSIPYVVRRIPAKIPAMGCAWIGLVGYLFLSGIDVATVRAFLMTTLVIAAFMFGRSVISLRNVALAFCVIFLFNPHYVMQAGFQLSFAAVFGLVWVYSVLRPKMPQNKLIASIYACALTSVVATVFTAPFVAAHFGAIPIYGLIGNLVILPIFSFAIMPLVLIGVVVGVWGWYGPQNLAYTIYEFALNIAQNISELPHAMVDVPHISNVAMACFVCAFMALIFIKTINIKVNYILFATFCVIGVAIVTIAPRPIFYATHDNELVAFVGDDGILEFNKSRASKHYFAFDTWKQINGDAIGTPNRRRKHDRGVWRYGSIVYIQKFVPLMQNIGALCNDDSVRYIVSYFNVVAPSCQHKILRGGALIYDSGRVEYVQRTRRWH